MLLGSPALSTLRFLGWGVSNWQAAFEWIAAGLRTRFPDLRTEFLGKGPQRMEALAAGHVDVAITTPTADAAMARAGIGPHAAPLPELRAIAALPHHDRLVLALTERAAEQYGIQTFADLAAERPPLRLAAPERDGDSPSYTVGRLLAGSGLKHEDLESWGGAWIEVGAPMPGPGLIAGGQADGVFNEAYMLLHAVEQPLRFIPFEAATLDQLRSELGLSTTEIEVNEFPGVHEPVPVVDFSDWVIMVRADLQDEIAGAMAEIVINDRQTFERRYHATPVRDSALYYPMRPEALCRTGDVPLHPAAQRFYKQIGVL